MTKFARINLTEKPKTVEIKKTVFKKGITIEKDIVKAVLTPNIFDKVILLPKSDRYGDVFIAFDNSCPKNYTIYFGEAGDEFNDE
jgi:hypothetical protein